MFTYQLPPSLIAHTPAQPRSAARLLTWPGLTEQPFSTLPNLLNPGDLLILNSSQVIPARLFATRPPRPSTPDTPHPTPIQVEILLHRPIGGDLSYWEVYAKPGRRLKHGDTLNLEKDGPAATLERIEPAAGEEAPYLSGPPFRLRFAAPGSAVAAYVQAHGHTPLPPYIHTQDSDFVKEKYQTVYANPATPGSVAAPTAGLHFTPEVLEALHKKGIATAHVTLHVGAGTFQNPTPEQIASGHLHTEYCRLSPQTAAQILATRRAGGKVIAVGTTACRTLESWGQKGLPEQGFEGDTSIFIQPGYSFTVVDKLLTNFHLPGSSLLMLVAAFIGEAEIAQLYDHAIKNRYRFYSFGDTSLLTRKGPQNA
ncbi:MAG: tRNA preQ1(34) S-adenosylmethionine ribosyltransferase-isomerase QueA [Proteobacteria bacterium]|nr:tRNA preQ1(34) S-adenosylmethionine ribosyltransferase-isomerase QueA [Pseudomonadota bacterium]